MILPSGYSTYDYSVSPRTKGWGQGWPVCDAGPLVTVVTKIQGARLPVHRDVARLFSLLLNEIERRGYTVVNGWSWGYACRAVSGTNSPSNHSWALAIDINAPTNSYNSSGIHDIPDWVYALFRAYGFGVGADYSGKQDWMHFEFMGTPDDARIMTALAERAFQQTKPPTRKHRRDEDDMTIVMEAPGRPWVLVDLRGVTYGIQDGKSGDAIQAALSDPKTRANVTTRDFDGLYKAVGAARDNEVSDDDFAALTKAITATQA